MTIYNASMNDVWRAQRAFHDRERREMVEADRARREAARRKAGGEGAKK